MGKLTKEDLIERFLEQLQDVYTKNSNAHRLAVRGLSKLSRSEMESLFIMQIAGQRKARS